VSPGTGGGPGRRRQAGQRFAGALHAQAGLQAQLGPQVQGLQLQPLVEHGVVISMLLNRPILSDG